MTYTQAKKYLARAERAGYVPCRSGICNMDEGRYYGINIDGDGRDGRLFGCPQIIWSAEEAEAKFPARKRKRRNATREQDISRTEYRLVVGESGNEQGHVVPCRATTEIGAKRCLGRELAEYQGDGWGYIECREAGQDGTCWRVY